MVNQNLNLQLLLNKSLSNLQDTGPYTPLDQTMKTPVDPPNYFGQFGNYGANLSYFYQQPPQPQIPQLQPQLQPQQHQIYSNPSYNESDDILTDVDDNQRGLRNYSLNFTTNFDHLVMSVYSNILSLPTTTPFSGIIPPSGLVSKVANETMSALISTTGSNNFPIYDQQHIINRDALNNSFYHPIFLQLIRKRLIELCSNKNNLNKLPLSTSISVGNQMTNNGVNPYNSNIRQSSISNLSLNELNLNQYHESKARNSSFNNLRKQSLTRNNSYSGQSGNPNTSNWLHVGNLNTIRHPNESTDSLQSMQDYVPQPFINRSGNSFSSNMTTPTNQSFGFNNMMLDYQTPPSSNKSSFSSPSGYSNIQIVQNTTPNSNMIPNQQEYDEFNFGNDVRSRSSSNSSRLTNSRPLTINTDNANLQALNSLNGNYDALDSPFMSATTPTQEYNNAFYQSEDQRVLPNKISLSEKKRDSLKLKRGIH